MEKKLSREELIQLVEKILISDMGEDDEEALALLHLFEDNVLDPEASGLIFWPSRYGLGDNPSPEEIVDKALSYKPILF